MTVLAIRHPITGEELPPFLTAREAAELLGRSERWVGLACSRGELTTLPHTPNSPWSIPTLPLLRSLGFDTAPDRPASDGVADAQQGSAQ